MIELTRREMCQALCSMLAFAPRVKSWVECEPCGPGLKWLREHNREPYKFGDQWHWAPEHEWFFCLPECLPPVAFSAMTTNAFETRKEAMTAAAEAVEKTILSKPPVAAILPWFDGPHATDCYSRVVGTDPAGLSAMTGGGF